jgi:mRNA interferase RelE/StbE
MLVVDASLVAEMTLDRISRRTTGALNTTLVAPPLLWSEVTSALREMAFRGDISMELAELGRDLRKIDPTVRRCILTGIQRLGNNAELTGDVKRLKGSSEYRLRVGDWRVRFTRDETGMIRVTRVLPRGRAYDR